jgi:pilus assembly protein CpaB
MNLSRIKAFRPSKTWVVLGVAVGIGLLAALAARSYLSSRMAELEAKARGRSVSVVVAKSDLVKGTKLSTETVAVRNVPMEFAHSSAVLPDQFERVEGQALAFNVKSGEIILWSLLEGKRVPTFSARVEAGRRAITVPVDEINSMSGLLEPGDLIDLMVTVDQKGKKVTLPLMQGVQVMATGQRSVDDPKSGERRIYSTVTLDTDPREAQNIIVARDAGRITALLRNPQDRTPPQGNLRDLAALLGAAPSAKGYVQEVPVLYGGRGAKLPADGLTLGGRPAPQFTDAAPVPTLPPAALPLAAASAAP